MNLHAVVTGGSDGVGKALVLELARNGCRVITIGRISEKLREVKKQYSSLIKVCIGDLTNSKDLKDFIQTVHREFNEIDLLVNNAGFQIGNIMLDKASLEDLQKMIDIHLMVPLSLYKAFFSKIKQNGMIINMISSVVNNYLKDTHGPYTVSKYAEYGLGKMMIKEGSKSNIKTTNVILGGVETNIRNSPRPDYLKPDDVAKTIVNLLQCPSSVFIPEICISPKIHVI